MGPREWWGPGAQRAGSRGGLVAEEEALVSVSSGDTAARGESCFWKIPLRVLPPSEMGTAPAGLVAGPVAAGARLRSRGALCGFLRPKKKKKKCVK